MFVTLENRDKDAQISLLPWGIGIKMYRVQDVNLRNRDKDV